ncbi:MAG: hypothetical protein SWY16_17545 [Cyanobacteriota bacterium]|nr:hypothetical protein [Cyanobacteriota bacterium]
MRIDRIGATNVTFNLTLIWRSLSVILLLFLLNACSLTDRPPDRTVVRQAISVQIDRVQQDLVQKLKLEKVPTWKIEKISIWEQQPVEIQYVPGFAVRGAYDLTLKLPSQTVARKNNPFEVYLQSQADSKHWRIARPHPNPTNSGVEWEIDPIEL